jgi:hypothetical protein
VTLRIASRSYDPMANDEHVAILKKGVAVWNEWCDQNPDINPDLVEADLRVADLEPHPRGPSTCPNRTLFC